jgi:uncharacterized protein YecT (DUF1311 family)
MRIILAVIVALASAAPVVAGDDGDIPGCAGASSNVEWDACSYAALEAADDELDALWPKVLASIEARRDDMPGDAIRDWKAAIVAAQNAWISFKENDCNMVEYEWWGGSGASLAQIGCVYHRTADRVADLKQRYLDP